MSTGRGVRVPSGCFHSQKTSTWLRGDWMTEMHVLNKWRLRFVNSRQLLSLKAPLSLNACVPVLTQSWCCDGCFVRLLALAKQRHAQPIQNTVNTTVQWWRTCVQILNAFSFPFFPASRKPKSRIDLLNEPGKDSPDKKNVRKVVIVGQSAAVRIQEDYHVTQIVRILKFPTETHQFYL